MVRTRWLLPAALALCAGCGSKITTTIDTALQDRVVTLKDCFPGIYPRLEALFTLASGWRLGSGTPIPDPVGVSAVVSAEASGTVVALQYLASGAMITMTIRFYGPTGVQQTLALDSGDSGDRGDAADGLDGTSSLNELIRAAAGQLRAQFPGDDLPFVVGDFAIAGGGIVATGEALLGLIGGTAAAPRLAEVRTCAPSSSIAGGPPATDPCTITDVGPPVCAIRFVTSDLALDETPAQKYAIGTVELSLDGPLANIVATITFDGTQTILLDVDGVRGRFAFDTETRAIAYLP